MSFLAENIMLDVQAELTGCQFYKSLITQLFSLKTAIFSVMVMNLAQHVVVSAYLLSLEDTFARTMNFSYRN